MKITYSLTTICLFLVLWCSGQNTQRDTMMEYYQKYPLLAIRTADSLYQAAIQKQDNPSLLKAIILKTMAELQIDENNYPNVLKEMEDRISHEKDSLALSILNSYTGELYANYYRNHLYTIRQRTNLKDYIPNDIEEWSANLFEEKILSHYLASLKDAHLLQQTSIDNYAPILLRTSLSDTLRPTLYDFLCHRAIEGLTETSRRVSQGQRITIGDTSVIFAPRSKFLSLDIPTVSQAFPNYILKMYQDLLTFRQQANNQEALLMADLERLECAQALSHLKNKNELYGVALQTLKEEFSNIPMVVEVMYKQIQFLNWTDAAGKIEKILAICQEGIQKYPNYARIGLLINQEYAIKKPDVWIEYPQQILPGKNIELKVNSQNFGEITFTIFKIKNTINQYQEMLSRLDSLPKDIELSPKAVYTQTFNLRSGYLRQDTTLNLTPITNGAYYMLVQSKESKKQIFQYFICTDLFTTVHPTPTGQLFFVRDAINGRAVEGAKVRIYKYTDYKNYDVIDSAYTDKQGFARTGQNGSKYEIVNHRNPYGHFCHLPSYHSYQPNFTRLELITDRGIYRPGQTIYFKGIAYFSSSDTLYSQKDQDYTVRLMDPNRKVIAQKQFRTNSYGSFAGQFELPNQILNGYYVLDCGQRSTAIQVTNYKRPEFNITFTESTNKYHLGDIIKVQGNVSSFSGVASANQEVTFQISNSYGRFWGSQQPTASGISHTNNEGDFAFNFKATEPLDKYNPYGMVYYEVKVSTTDTKGETQSSTIVIPVFTGRATPIIQIPEKVDKNQPTSFVFHLEDADPDVNNQLHYAIYSLKDSKNISMNLEMKDTLTDKMILQGEVQVRGTDSVRITPDLSKYKSGAYLFILKNKELSSKSIFYLYSARDQRPPINTYDWLVEKKTVCAPGETASVLFGTSVANAHINYEIYTQEGLVGRTEKQISNGILHIRIPYQADYGSQIWLHIDYIKDGHYIDHLIPIKKEQKKRDLRLETKVFRNHLESGQKEQWEIVVKDLSGQPIRAEVLAMMYDASLDKLQPYDIGFKPMLYQPSFPYRRAYCPSQGLKNYFSLSFPASNNQKYIQIPLLSFDRLMTFPTIADMLQMKMSASDDIIITGSAKGSNIRIRGTSQKENGMSPSLRQDFSETAFFYPQLQSNSNGEVFIRFTVPETNTTWKFIALAQTPELSVGEITKYVTTSRQLMVRPNLPRFFRSGDQTELKVTISNTTSSQQTGEATITLFDPETSKVLTEKMAKFNIAAGKSQTVSFTFDVPQNIDLAGCRIMAHSNSFSDGEQHLIPILPDRLLVTSTLPIYTAQKGTQTFSMRNANSNFGNGYRLTLEMSSNPLWYAVLALPSLQEPQNASATDIASAFYVNTIAAKIANHNPQIAETIRNWMASLEASKTLLSKLEQNSELKSILLEVTPWVMQAQNETERMQSLQQLFDENRLNYLQADALGKLQELQNPNGGWCWFKGMYSSRFITCHILAIMSQANLVGEKEYGEQEKKMQINALRYLDNEIQKDYAKKDGKIRYDQILYLYIRSMYRDIPLGDALEAHKYYMSLAQKQWSLFSLYEKGVIATAMYRYGLGTDARAILKSLREFAVTTPNGGMYWSNNKNHFYQNSALLVHTALMEAFHEIEGNTAITNQMKQWLLNQKQTQDWGNVPATVNAIHALLLTGSDELANKEQLQLSWGNKNIPIATTNNPLGYVKKSVNGSEITPDLLTVKVTKATDNPSWGGLYFQYFERFEQVNKESEGISVDKKLFVEQLSPNGEKTLIPAGQTTLKIGDKVIVRLVLSLKQNMDYLHLQDLRAACLEPEQQISRNQWNFGTMYYEDVKDASTNFFFNSLSKGTYVIEYPLRVNQAGEYQDGIATFQSIYAPEFNAHSDAIKIKVED